jgi:hypothetical protein
MASTRDVISPGIFAEDASTTIPPSPIQGVSYRDPVAGPASAPDGWPFFEKVNSAEFNQLLFQYSSLLDILDKQGVLGWSDLRDYEAAALVYGSDGLLYLWLQDSGPGTVAGFKDPVSEPDYWQQFASHGAVSFTVAGVTEWTVPLAMKLGAIKPKITVVGGGASGSRINATAGGGGGSGGASFRVVDLTGVTSVTVTVGAGGPAQSNGLVGAAGGASSFGTFLSATGGQGASPGGQGGTAGVGVGGDLNATGNGGGSAAQGTTGSLFMGGHGGGSFFGGGAKSNMVGSATVGFDGENGGGGGGNVLNASAGAGGDGVVLVEW